MDILPDLLPSESDDLVVDISLDAASSGVSVISNSLVGFSQRIDWLNGWQICWVIDILSFDSSSQSSSKVLSIIFSLLLTLTLLLLLLLLLVLSVGLVTVYSFDELLLCLWSPWSTSSSQNLTFRLCSTWQGNLTVDNFFHSHPFGQSQFRDVRQITSWFINSYFFDPDHYIVHHFYDFVWSQPVELELSRVPHRENSSIDEITLRELIQRLCLCSILSSNSEVISFPHNVNYMIQFFF